MSSQLSDSPAPHRPGLGKDRRFSRRPVSWLSFLMTVLGLALALTLATQPTRVRAQDPPVSNGLAGGPLLCQGSCRLAF